MTAKVDILDSVGDLDILKSHKTAFLCSRSIPAGLILKCYDWAIEQRETGKCVIGGFHSTIEKDVFHYLLKGTQPLIIALHRGIGPDIVEKFRPEIDSGRLLIVSPFERNVKRGSQRTAMIRNQLMVELAESVVVGYASTGGQIDHLLKDFEKTVSFIGG